ASSRFISSGLGRTARAAARRASSARSSCANAVIMITASCGASAFIVFKASTPLRPGIRTSMRTRSGQVWVTTPTAATAELAVVTAYPKADRMSASVSAIPESSSTTKTDRTATTSAGRLGHGEPHLEAAAAPRGALDRHHAAVGVDEHLGHRQPQPDPLGLRRKQRLEDLLHVLGGDADSRIRHRDPDAVAARRRFDRQGASLWHRLRGVRDEVAQHRPELIVVDEQLGQVL